MIYLDNSATTPLSPAVREKMADVMENVWGNPSSLHAMGLAAEREVNEARTHLLAALGVRDPAQKTVVFCGSGTEADNLALFGVCHAKDRPKTKRIVISDSEHAAILESALRLEKEGVEVVRLSTRRGRMDPDEVRQAVNADTVLISVMLVNNETGAIYPVRELFEAAREKNPAIVTHTDAVQGFRKIPFTAASLGADLITVSSHKIHGPKGVGALIVDREIIKTKKLVPVICGGGQEKGFRSGTENVIGIAGFGEAVKTAMDGEKVRTVRDRILSLLPGSVRYNAPDKAAPHILSLTLPGVKSETMLHFLSEKGIYVSSGSACSSHSGHVSGTLLAFGLDEAEADHTVRVSLDDCVTEDDAAVFAEALKEGLARLARV